MTIYALVTGSLRGEPQQKTSANGKEYVLAFMVSKDGNERVGVRIMAFGGVGDQLLSVADGGAFTVQGMLRPEIYTGKDGVARLSTTLFANSIEILTKPAFKKEARKVEEEPKPVEKKEGLDRHAGEGVDYFGDSVPFLTISAREISKALHGQATSGGFVCRCPVSTHGKGKGDRSPSLSIKDGPDGLIVNCHSGCDARDIYAALRSRGLLCDDPQRYRDEKRTSAPRSPLTIDDKPKATSDLARRLWAETVDPRRTIGERYLTEERGLVGVLDDVTARTIRFHHGAPFKDDGKIVRSPTLVCAVRSLRGAMGAAMAIGDLDEVERKYLSDLDQVCAVQRIRLTGDAKKVERRSLGDMGDDGIILCSSIWESFYDSHITIGEGVETMLAMRLLGARGCAALTGASRFKNFEIPPHIGSITISSEADEASRRSWGPFASRWLERDREIRVWEPVTGKDANDALRGAA